MNYVAHIHHKLQKVSVNATTLLAILLITETIISAMPTLMTHKHSDSLSCFLVPKACITTTDLINTPFARLRHKIPPAFLQVSLSYCIKNKCEFESVLTNYRHTRYSRAHHVVHHQLLI